MLIRFLLFFFALPLIVALGHDLYLFYENQEKGFQFATIGFIWAKYNDQSLREFMRPFEQEEREMIGMVLTQYASVIGLGYMLFFYFWIGVYVLFSGRSYRKSEGVRTKKKSRVDRMMDRQKGKTRRR